MNVTKRPKSIPGVLEKIITLNIKIKIRKIINTHPNIKKAN